MDIDLIEEIPQYKQWIEKAKGSSFFGKKLDDMSREELFGFIGWMEADANRRISTLKQEHKMFMDIEKNKPKTPVHDFVNKIMTANKDAKGN
jgi:hypothetical protein